eukprot:COSAG04_NODE_15906_length_516_cov_0.877698_1_plen_69_part_10
MLHCANRHYTGYRRLPQGSSPPARRPRLSVPDKDDFTSLKELHQGHVGFDGWWDDDAQSLQCAGLAFPG